MKLSISIFLLCVLSCSSRFDKIYFSTDPKSFERNTSSEMEFDFREEFSGIQNVKNDYKALFNAIYFKGDTAGFFFNMPSLDAEKTEIRVSFINKADGKEYPADRIETRDGIVWGFSNLGGLLEYFYYDKLFQRVEPNNGKLLAEFILSVQIDSGGKIEKMKRDGRLVVYY
ncbi:MAG TPA: hypothetical protein PK624_01895 [Spirochaetota bacterium]|nr:hypothetical protein [Spirochaetota bacterium]HOR43528.1 hypothetical protein [Spirochaetota bacterium]HPK55688.1 hypothetical protein [Spirochaetota bacterium]